MQLIGSCISPPFEGSGAGLQKQGNGWGGGGGGGEGGGGGGGGGYLTLVKHITVVKTKYIHSGHYHVHVHSCITWAMAAKDMVQPTGCIEMLLISLVVLSSPLSTSCTTHMW